MRKEDCDRIIVETNEKMGKVIQWYQDNQEWLDKEEFHAPMESGYIVLKEEGLEVTFESKEDVVELAANMLVARGEKVRFPAVVTEQNGNQSIEEYYEPLMVE